MLKILCLTIAILFINGCALGIGKNDFACGSSEDLKDAGTCGSTEFIRNNLHNMEDLAYKGMKKVNGAYIKCETEDGCTSTKKREMAW